MSCRVSPRPAGREQRRVNREGTSVAFLGRRDPTPLHRRRRGILPGLRLRGRGAPRGLGPLRAARAGAGAATARRAGAARGARHLFRAGLGGTPAPVPGARDPARGSRDRVPRLGSRPGEARRIRRVPGLGAPQQTGARGHHRRAGLRLPRAEFLHRARPGVGARRAHRRRLRLRFEPLPHPASRLRLSRRRSRPALAGAARGPGGRDSAHHIALLRPPPSGRGRRLLPDPPLRARPRGVPRLRAPRRSRNVLHPPLGNRPRPAAVARALARPAPALHRTRRNRGAARAAPRRVPLRAHRADGGRVMTVVPIDGDAAWDAFVARDPAATFCHLAAWRSIMTDVLGHECLYLAALDSSGAWEGVLPLVRVKAPFLGHYLISMPFLNAGGPLGTPAARLALAGASAAEAARSGADLLELRAREAVPGELRLSQRKITVGLPLPGSADQLWAAF